MQSILAIAAQARARHILCLGDVSVNPPLSPS